MNMCYTQDILSWVTNNTGYYCSVALPAKLQGSGAISEIFLTLSILVLYEKHIFECIDILCEI